MGRKKDKRELQAAPELPLTGGTGRPPVQSRYNGGAGLNAGSAGSFLFGWNPALREPYVDVREGYISAAARAIDTIQNSGHVSGAVELAAGQMIGDGLKLSPRPDPTLFGGSEADAKEWSTITARLFNAWARDPWECDLAGKATFGQLQDQAVRQYFATGEMVGTLPMVRRPGNKFASKVSILPSMRLVQASTLGGPFNQIQGIVLGPNMEPAAYVFWNNAIVFGTQKLDIVQGRTRLGRPVVIHVFNGEPGTFRGMTPLVSALKVTRQIDQLADATLTASLLQTIFAATVQSDAPTEEMLRALQGTSEQDDNPDLEGAQPGDFDRLMGARLSWYKNTRIDLGTFGKIAHLFPGEELKFNASQHPNDNYEVFHKALLREIARGLNVSYESVSGDYIGATYSSLMQQRADLWGITLKRRSFYPVRMCDMVYSAWLEEAIAIGAVAFPGGLPAFYENRSLATLADWLGPPKPIADDLKTAKANQILRAEGWVSRKQICADYGGEFYAVNAERAEVVADDERLGLDPPPPPPGGGSITDQTGDNQDTSGGSGDATG